MLAEEGPGFPFFLPKGMALKNTLIDYWREIHKQGGLRGGLHADHPEPQACGRRSGHWDHYKNNMYTTVIDDEDYAIKPMNCPGGMLVYKHAAALLPRPAAARGRAGSGTPPRAVRRAARPVPCALLHAGRRAYLHDARIRSRTRSRAWCSSDRRGVLHCSALNIISSCPPCPEDHMGSDEDWEMADQTASTRRIGRAGHALCGQRGRRRVLRPEAGLPSGRLPLAVPGSAAPFSWTSSCLSASSWSTPARTARSTVRS